MKGVSKIQNLTMTQGLKLKQINKMKCLFIKKTWRMNLLVKQVK